MEDLNAEITKPEQTMSNSDYIEELMFKANDRGFFREMHPQVDKIKKENPNIDSVDAYLQAYTELKEEHVSAENK